MMIAIPFDIFQATTGGGVLWLESAITLQQARGRVQELAGQAPGDYLLLNRETGNKLVISIVPWEN